MLGTSRTLEQNGHVEVLVRSPQVHAALKQRDVGDIGTNLIVGRNLAIGHFRENSVGIASTDILVLHVAGAQLIHEGFVVDSVCVDLALIFKYTVIFVGLIRAYGPTRCALPFGCARSFVPKQNLILCIPPVDTDVVFEVSCLIAVANVKFKASV